MEPLTDVKVEPFEQNWKDWFIVDEPKDKIKLTVFADKTRIFYVDPRFNRFRFTGTMKSSTLSQYQICYMFKKDHLKVQTSRGYVSIMDIDSNYRLFQVIMLFKGGKNDYQNNKK